MQTGKCIDHLAQPPGVKHGMCMAVQLYTPPHTHELHALVGYEDGQLVVWNVFSGQILASRHLHDEPVMAVAVDAAGTGQFAAFSIISSFWGVEGEVQALASLQCKLQC